MTSSATPEASHPAPRVHPPRRGAQHFQDQPRFGPVPQRRPEQGPDPRRLLAGAELPPRHGQQGQLHGLLAITGWVRIAHQRRDTGLAEPGQQLRERGIAEPGQQPCPAQLPDDLLLEEGPGGCLPPRCVPPGWRSSRLPGPPLAVEHRVGQHA
jgi:hypothetical protein